MATVKNIDIGIRSMTEEFEAGMKRSASATVAFGGNADRVASQMGKAANLFQQGAIGVDEYSKTIRECEQELTAMQNGFSGMGDATARAQAVLRGIETETDKYNRKLQELNALKQVGALKEHEHARAVAHTTAEYHKAIPAAEAVGNKTSFLTTLFDPMTTRLVAAAAAFKGLQIGANLAKSAMHGIGAQMEEVDSAKKAASTIGIATGELLKLRFAVKEVAGVEIDDTLKRMIRNIADAATTGKGATDTINRLGLSVSSLASMSPERAFFTLTDAISNLEGSGARASAAVEIFGKQGVDLGPIFENGAAALKDSAEFAEKFGLKISEVDTSAIEQANDTLGRLSAILDGLYRQIAAELAPQIIAFGKTVIDMGADGEGAIGKIRTAFSIAGIAASYLVESIDEIVNVLQRMALPKPFADAIDLFIKARAAVSEVNESMSGSKSFTEQYTANLEKVKKELAELEKQAQKDFTIGGRFDENSDSAQKSAASAQKSAASKAKAELSAKNKVAAESERRAKLVRDMEREVSGNSAEVKFKHTVEDINQLLAKQLITLEKRNQLVAQAHKTIIVDPQVKKEMEAKKKQVAEASKVRADTDPMAKFAAEAEKIRKLELAGHLTDQQAAQATLEARKHALAELVKLHKEQIKVPTFTLETPKFPNFEPEPIILQQPNIQTPKQPNQFAGMNEMQNRFASITSAMQERTAQTQAGNITAAKAEEALRMEALKARGDELKKQFDPRVAFQTRMAELKQLSTVPGMDKTTIAAAQMDARKKLLDEMDKLPEFKMAQEQKGPAAVEAGSQAAFSAFQQARRDVNKADEQVAWLKRIESAATKMARNAVVLSKAPRF